VPFARRRGDGRRAERDVLDEGVLVPLVLPDRPRLAAGSRGVAARAWKSSRAWKRGEGGVVPEATSATGRRAWRGRARPSSGRPPGKRAAGRQRARQSRATSRQPVGIAWPERLSRQAAAAGPPPARAAQLGRGPLVERCRKGLRDRRSERSSLACAGVDRPPDDSTKRARSYSAQARFRSDCARSATIASGRHACGHARSRRPPSNETTAAVKPATTGLRRQSRQGARRTVGRTSFERREGLVGDRPRRGVARRTAPWPAPSARTSPGRADAACSRRGGVGSSRAPRSIRRARVGSLKSGRKVKKLVRAGRPGRTGRSRIGPGRRTAPAPCSAACR